MTSVSRRERLKQALLAAGLDSDLADQAVLARYTVSKLRRASKTELKQVFGDEGGELIAMRLRRQRLPATTVLRLLLGSDGKCCLCWKFSKESPIIFHHIIEHSREPDDSYENLLVLCLHHHDEVHAVRKLSRHRFPPDFLRDRKASWNQAVDEHHRGLRPPPGDEPTARRGPKPAAPAASVELVGRQGKLAQLQEAVLTGNRRAAVIGMPAVGKTFLAMHSADHLSEAFPGGVFWASFGDSSGDAGRVITRLAGYCDAQIPDGIELSSAADRLRSSLAAYSFDCGPILIVLDDARTEWIDAFKLVLTAVPSSAALVLTTREKALASVANCVEIELKVLEQADAWTLLERHSQRSFGTSDIPAVRRLLALVGNLPLAVELLGKYIWQYGSKPGFALQMLVSDLQQEILSRLKLPGHSGLAAVFRVSYRALSDSNKRGFRWIGAFASDLFCSHDVSSVLGHSNGAAETLLDELVLCSLLNWGQEQGSYRIHPLLHRYATDLLASSKRELQRARTAHLKHFASAILQATDSKALRERRWEDLLPEVVHGAAASEHEPEIVLQLASSLWTESGLMHDRGYYREGQLLLDAGVKAARKLGRVGDEAVNVGNLGVTHDVLGRSDEAEACYRRALALADRIGETYDRPAYLGNLGMVLQNRGEWGAAVGYFQEAYGLAVAEGNLEVAINQIGNLGTAYRTRDPNRAIRFYQEGLRLAGRMGQEVVVGSMISNIGLIYMDAGALDEAEEHITKALSIARRVHDRKGEANRLGHLGTIAHLRNDVVAAREYFDKALEMSHEIGFQSRESAWLGNLGQLCLEDGDLDAAEMYISKALQIAIAVRAREIEGRNHMQLAELFTERGETLRAEEHAAEARRIFTDIPTPIALHLRRAPARPDGEQS